MMKQIMSNNKLTWKEVHYCCFMLWSCYVCFSWEQSLDVTIVVCLTFCHNFAATARLYWSTVSTL